MAENVRIVKNKLDQGVDHYEPSSAMQHSLVLEATASFAIENFILHSLFQIGKISA